MACSRRLTPLALLLVALGATTSMSACGGCAKFVGPEGEIAQYLAVQPEAEGARFAIPGGAEVVLSQVRFDHVLVKPEGEGLTAVAQVDAEGTYAGEAKVSYIGLERVPFVRKDGRWRPRGALLPALQDVGALLVARRAAHDARDPAAMERLVAKAWSDETTGREAALAAMKDRLSAGQVAAKPRSWIVRVERERSEVLEETAAGATRLVLVREGGQLRIASGSL